MTSLIIIIESIIINIITMLPLHAIVVLLVLLFIIIIIVVILQSSYFIFLFCSDFILSLLWNLLTYWSIYAYLCLFDVCTLVLCLLLYFAKVSVPTFCVHKVLALAELIYLSLSSEMALCV